VEGRERTVKRDVNAPFEIAVVLSRPVQDFHRIAREFDDLALPVPEFYQDAWDKLMRIADYAEDALAYFCD
jgi:hypothetical protein